MNSPVVFKRLKDALKDIFLLIIGKDCDGAIRNDQSNCVAAKSAKRIHHFEDVVVMRNIFYARNHGTDLWRRWIIDHEGVNMIKHFDKSGILPPDGITLRLIKPKGVRKLDYKRSDEFKKLRDLSAKRRKGKKRRPYNNDPLPGVRWGKSKRKKAA